MRAISSLLLCLYGTIMSAAHPVNQVEDRYDSMEKVNMDFQQQDLNSNVGVYFEEIANLQVYHTEWAFVTYVNLTYFEVEMEHLELTVKNIQKLCDSIKNEFLLSIPSSYCDHAMPQLYNLLDETKEFDIKWLLNHETDNRDQNTFYRSQRKKRGFFGTISKRLFSSISEDDAAFYRRQISTLKMENMQHISFANNQTTLFQETLTVLNNTMQSQIIQHSALQKQFDDVENLLNNDTVSSILTEKLNELMQYATFVIISFWEKQRYFFELITKKSKNFRLIPPKKFISELERVSQLISSQGLLLPLPLTIENLSKFYRMTSIEAGIIDNNLVLRFSIPLVDKRNFTLYKVISAPHRDQSNGTFNFIVPQNKYIAHDINDELFLTLTLEELRNCHRIDEEDLICKLDFPILLSANDNSGCEINLFRKTNHTQNCDFEAAKLTEEIWVKMQKPNTYLYTLPKIQTVAINCPHSRTKLLLHDTGIISLTQNCRIRTERVEIIAFQTIESKTSLQLTTSAKFNTSVAIDIAKSKNVKSLSNSKLPDHIGKEDINKLTKIRENIDDLHHQNMIIKASMMNTLNDVGENRINPVILLILSVAMIVVAIVVIIICFKYCAVPGCSILIFLVSVALVIPGVILLI